MTNPYDEMRVTPDPVKTEELRRRLRARMANISVDDDHRRTALELDSADQPDERMMPMIELSPPDTSTDRRAHRRRVMVAAAAIVVAIAAAGIALSIEDPPSGVTTASQPTTSRASTTSAATATTEYAAVVREYSAAIRDWGEREASCTHVECSLVQYAQERYVELRTILRRFDQELEELPPPPDELEELVDRTRARVNAAVDRVNLFVSCEYPAPNPFACNDELSEAEAAYKRVPPVLRTWGV